VLRPPWWLWRGIVGVSVDRDARKRQIREVKRTWRHPFGRVLWCAYPPCFLNARLGYEIVTPSGVVWPHCSKSHQMSNARYVAEVAAMLDRPDKETR
jgi:hypothetical protein